MAHELVFRMNALSDGTVEKVARMIFRDRSAQGLPGLPWHGYGEKHEQAISLAQVHEALGTDTEYKLENLKTESGLILEANKAVTWEGNVIAVVGNNFKPLQNRVAVDEAARWLEAGHEIETAGLLCGGARMWIQIRLNVDPTEVRKGDEIRPYALFGHGNDGQISMNCGLTDVRTVCNNTFTQALAGGGYARKKHTADVNAKAAEVHETTMRLIQQHLTFAEKAKFLASKPANARTVQDFVFTMQGKPTGISEDLLKKEYERENSVLAQIESLFVQGRGNRGQDMWDIFNAWTERTTHGDLNERKGESAADREGRRLDSLYFGTAATSSQKAFNVLLAMAKAA